LNDVDTRALFLGLALALFAYKRLGVAFRSPVALAPAAVAGVGVGAFASNFWVFVVLVLAGRLFKGYVYFF